MSEFLSIQNGNWKQYRSQWARYSAGRDILRGIRKPSTWIKIPDNDNSYEYKEEIQKLFGIDSCRILLE